MQGVMLLRDVLAKDSTNPEANLKLGDLSMMSGQFRNAATRYEKATAADSTSTEAWVGLGNAYMALGMKPEALEAFTHASMLMDSGQAKAAVDQVINELKN
jgi:cytochrome c-type biogenesis protein CcmH/NrfG